jgi:hypothetical protein
VARPAAVTKLKKQSASRAYPHHLANITNTKFDYALTTFDFELWSVRRHAMTRDAPTQKPIDAVPFDVPETIAEAANATLLMSKVLD